jgi:hypothetical protein
VNYKINVSIHVFCKDTNIMVDLDLNSGSTATTSMLKF